MTESPLDVKGQTILFKTSEAMDELEKGQVSFVITSPPYWNLKNYNHPNQIGQESYDRYIERMNTVWEECFRVTKDNGLLAININSRRHEKIFYPIAMDIYSNIPKWKLIDVFIWYVPNALPQPAYYIDKLFDNKFEFVLLFAKNYNYDYTFHKIRVFQKYVNIDPRSEKYHPEGRCIGNIIRIPAYRPPNIKQRSYHVAAFPEELVYVFLSAYTNPKEYVLDPFLGSGTTLKVCRVTNRKGIGYEIDTTLKETINRRILEPWTPPSFEELDIINSSFAKPKSKRRRPKLKQRPIFHKQQKIV